MSSSDTIVPWNKQVIASRVLSALVVLTRSSSWRPQQLRTTTRCANQYHPSLIPKESCTCLIRPPKRPRALCCCCQPRPDRVCLETAHLPDTRSTSTAQHSSTDPAHLYLPCSQTCPPSLSSPPRSCCRSRAVVGQASVPAYAHDDLRACVPPIPGAVRKGSLLEMEKA